MASWSAGPGRTGPIGSGRWRTARISPAGGNATCWPPGAGGAGAAAAAGRSRQAVRTPGKSYPIDALAVARLPGPGLRRTTTRLAHATADAGSLVQVRICQAQPTAIQTLSDQIDQLDRQLRQRVARLAPSLLSLAGCGPLTAAKLIAETAGVARLRSEACFAMHAGVAPIPVSSGRTDRHRLSCGNRQLNAALHRIAITQLRLPGPGQSYYQRRRARGDGTGEPSAPSGAARPRRLPAPPSGPAASPHRPHGSRLTAEQPSRPGCPCSG